MGLSQRFSDFDLACSAELSAIKRHQPPFNKNMVSSPGMLGRAGTTEFRHTEEAKQRIGLAGIGRRLSPEHKAALAAGAIKRIGRKQKPEHIEKIRQANTGRKRSQESIAKMKAAQQRRKDAIAGLTHN